MDKPDKCCNTYHDGPGMNKRAVSFVIRLASPSIFQGSVHFIGQGIIAPPNDRDTDLSLAK